MDKLDILSSRLFKVFLLLVILAGISKIFFVFSGPYYNISGAINVNYLITLLLVVIVLIIADYLIKRRELSNFRKGLGLIDDFRYEEALQYFDKILKLNPKDSISLSGKSIALLKLNNTDEALKYSGEALDVKLGASKFLVKNNINLIRINTIAMVLYELKKYDGALKYSKKVLKLSPRDSVAWSNKGTNLSHLGEYEKAMKCYNKALRLNSKDPYALDNKSDTLRKMGKYQEAMENVDKSIKSNPKFPDALLTKGKILRDMNRHDEALKYIN